MIDRKQRRRSIIAKAMKSVIFSTEKPAKFVVVLKPGVDDGVGSEGGIVCTTSVSVSASSSVSSGLDNPMLLDVYFIHGGRPVLFSVDSRGGSQFSNRGDCSDDSDEENVDGKPLWSMELILATVDWRLIPMGSGRG